MYSNNTAGLFVDLTVKNLDKTSQKNEKFPKKMAAIRVKWIPCLKSWNLLGQNCNENDVYNVAFKVRMVPSDSMEDSVQKMGRCPRI